jgi:hypothetical protein
MTLADVDRFRVPADVIAHTEICLRRAGKRGLEVFVLWSGLLDGSMFTVRTVHIPRQTSYELEGGLMVRVDGDALHTLNKWLYEHQEVLAVQVHAHPTDAFHSNTDDAYPIVTAEGSLSIVAPDFCRDGLLSDATVAYRLRKGRWREVDPPVTLFEVV